MIFGIAINKVLITAFVFLLVGAAVIDFREYRIPNFISVAILALYTVHVLASPTAIAWGWALAVAGGLLAFAAVLFSFRVIGGGDAKLLVAGGLWAGPGLATDYILITVLAGGAMALFLMSPLGRGLALVADAAGQIKIRNFLLNDVLPYGVAIAAGGVFVGLTLLHG